MRRRKPKYLLITGAPGSKWSSVALGIYSSPEVNDSDSSKERTYNKMHAGAYWDPGMEFENDEEYWDAPFTKKKAPLTKIIKSHTFAHNLDYLKTLGHPIILVIRPDIECFYWWKSAGGFDITYPNYKPYYKNEKRMWKHIKKQNSDIHEFIYRNNENVTRVNSNLELAETLALSATKFGFQAYGKHDINVYLYSP